MTRSFISRCKTAVATASASVIENRYGAAISPEGPNMKEMGFGDRLGSTPRQLNRTEMRSIGGNA
jgi:hypothetical protein